MIMTDDRKCWLNGKIIPENEAQVSIMTHSLQYGSGIFEGIRAYETVEGPAIFRLDEHVDRFIKTAKIYMIDLGYTREQIKEAIIETVRVNKYKSAYIRPFAFYDDQRVGVSTQGKKISVFIGAFEFGKYFSNADSGLRCKISSLRRFDSSSLPTQAKGSGNYLNSVLAMKEAKRSGFDEA
ncbi:Aminotransferase, class IV, partial [mine drainage metagenome]